MTVSTCPSSSTRPDPRPLIRASMSGALPDVEDVPPQDAASKDKEREAPPKKKAKAKAGEGSRAELPPRPVLPGILLGEELFAHTLRVYLGSDVYIACPMCGVGPTGPMPKLKPFRVAEVVSKDLGLPPAEVVRRSLATARREKSSEPIGFSAPPAFASGGFLS